MSAEVIVNYCAPTMAGIKTGNLFSHDFASKEELINDLRRYNELFLKKGMCMVPLKTKGTWALLYLFRKECLEHDLEMDESVQILQDAGYESLDYRHCISWLINRLKTSEDFPHEIGLFLSYPPEDVRAFIDNHAKGFKMVGYWKVYGDANAAIRQFSAFDRCTLEYKNRLKMGSRLENLIV